MAFHSACQQGRTDMCAWLKEKGSSDLLLFVAALHQPVEDVEAFVRMHSGPYEKLIDPQLWFKNSEPPHGMQRATLPMCFQKGWGAGTAALARKLREKHGLRVPE